MKSQYRLTSSRVEASEFNGLQVVDKVFSCSFLMGFETAFSLSCIRADG